LLQGEQYGESAKADLASYYVKKLLCWFNNFTEVYNRTITVLG